MRDRLTVAIPLVVTLTSIFMRSAPVCLGPMFAAREKEKIEQRFVAASVAE